MIRPLLASLLLAFAAPASAQEEDVFARYYDAPLSFQPPNSPYTVPGSYQFLRPPGVGPTRGPQRLYMRTRPEDGYNASVVTNWGRTGIPALMIHVDHDGQGDGGGITVICHATGAARADYGIPPDPGTSGEHWLANPACYLFNGQVDADADGVFMNTIEVHMDDHGHADVSGIGQVVSFNRSGPDSSPGSPTAVRAGYRSQSTGLPIGAGFVSTGNVVTGVDLTSSYSDEQSGVALRLGDRIYWSAAPETVVAQGTRYLGKDWTGAYYYPDGSHAIMTIVGGNPTLQVQRDWLAIAGHVAIQGELMLIPPRELVSGECARTLELLPSGHVVAGEMRCR